MRILDEEGNLFGVVNAIDALAVFLTVLILSGGIAVAYTSGNSTADTADPGILTQVVSIESTVPSRTMAEGITPGPVDDNGIVQIEDVSIGKKEDGVRVLLRTRLRINITESGLTIFRGERLYIGKELTLKIDGQSFTGVVTDASEPERIIPRTATATPTGTNGMDSDTGPNEPTAVPGPSPQTETQGEPFPTRVITVQANVSDRVASAISEGPVRIPDIVRIEDKQVEHHSDTSRITFRIRLRVTRHNDTVYFRGVELVEGQQLLLHLGNTTVPVTIDSL